MDENLKISFPDSPFCEHCGSMSPGTCIVQESEGGTPWCIYCADANDMDIDIEALEKQEEEAERKHLVTRLAELDAKKS